MKAIKADGTVDWAKAMKLLKEPFSPSQLNWRVGNVARSGKKCTLLCYLAVRAVDERLDEVCGGHWSVSYGQVFKTGLMCTISVEDGDVVRSRQDGGDESNFEATKGTCSDARKRAAAVWGVGRYLYNLGSEWCEILGDEKQWAPKGGGIDVSSNGKHLGWVMLPSLPDHALPKSEAWRELHKEFFAVLGEAGISYEEMCKYCTLTNRRRPSRMQERALRGAIEFVSDENGISLIKQKLKESKKER